jgi:hypothetical protein
MAPTALPSEMMQSKSRGCAFTMRPMTRPTSGPADRAASMAGRARDAASGADTASKLVKSPAFSR